MAGRGGLLEGLKRAARELQASAQEVVEVLQPGPLKVWWRATVAGVAARRALHAASCTVRRTSQFRHDFLRSPPHTTLHNQRAHMMQLSVKWDAQRRADAAAAVQAAVQRWREVDAACEREAVQQQRQQWRQQEQQQEQQQQQADGGSQRQGR